jgi:hypothetical protein
METKCPVCAASNLSSVQNRQMSQYFECPGCGAYAMTLTAIAVLQGTLKQSDEKERRAKLSHAIYKMSRGGKWAEISSELLNAILQGTLPAPSDQLNNLVTWLATQGRLGSRIDASLSVVPAIGAIDFSGFAFIAEEARKRGLIDSKIQTMTSLGPRGDQYVVTPMQLTVAGWDRVEALRRARPDSRIAFMAMPFGKPELDAMYFGHFQTAVKAAGFTLKRLDEDQPAGLIDDRLRVEIRQCRFLIADLSHGNGGAYWEAGYAEGLGKPVIYTCEKSVFDDRTKGTHFDTNHHLTVVWESAAPMVAATKLKATIRATLPTDAVLSDDAQV